MAAEAFDFDLRLVDAVTAPAKRMAAAVASIEQKAKKTQAALDFGKEISKAEQNLKRLTIDPKGFVEHKKLLKELGEKRSKLLEGAGLKGESFGESIKKSLGVGRIATGAFLGELAAEGVFKIVEGFAEGAKAAVEIVTEGVKKGFEEAGKQQTLRIGEKLSLGKGAGEFREDTGRFSKLTGFDDDAIRSLLLPLRRAGFNQQGARTAFAAASDVAAGEGRGGDQGRVNELLSGFQDIFLKGGVGEKKLVGLGVDAKEFYANLSKQLKISPDTAKKRAEEGKIDRQLLLNEVYRGIERKQGGKLGTGSIEYSKSFEAHLNKVKNLPNEYLKNLVDSPAFARANELLGGLLEKLDPDSPTGKRIMASIDSMFSKIGDLIGDPGETADKLASAIEQAVSLMSDLIALGKDLADALLPSLNTIQDITLGIREALAIADVAQGKSGAIGKLDQIEREKGQLAFDRISRPVMKENQKTDKALYGAALRTGASAFGIGDMMTANAYALGEVGKRYQKPDAAGSKGGDKNVTVKVEAGAVAVHAAPGEDQTHTHQKMGQDVHRAVVNAVERGAAEVGG